MGGMPPNPPSDRRANFQIWGKDLFPPTLPHCKILATPLQSHTLRDYIIEREVRRGQDHRQHYCDVTNIEYQAIWCNILIYMCNRKTQDSIVS